MKKPLLAVLAVALVSSALVAPAQAKGKTPKARAIPVAADRTYYLVNEHAGSTGCAAEGMVLKLAPGEGVGCQNGLGGAPTAAFVTAFDSYCTPEVEGFGFCGHTSHEAIEGLPINLDGSKKITGTILVRSQHSPDVPAAFSAGPTTFNIRLRGTVNGIEEVIGTFSVDYLVTPDKPEYEVPFEVAVPAELDRVRLTTFGIDLWNTGTTLLHGSYEVNTSQVVVPVWTPGRGVRP